MSRNHRDQSRLLHSLESEYTLSRQEAEDIVSEATFLVLFKWGADQLGNARLLEAVAHKVARNFVRSRTRRAETPLASEDNPPIRASEATIEPGTAESLLYDLCRAANIERPEDIRLLKMRLLEGLSYRELSDLLAVREASLRQRICRLTAQLRDVL